VFVWTLPAFIGAGRPGFDPSGLNFDPNGLTTGLTSGLTTGSPTAVAVDGSAVLWGAIGLAISHVFSFVANYLGRGEYRKVSAVAQAGRPYGRVVILHLGILFGGFLSLMLGSPIGALLVLVALKTGIDVALHRREHDRLADRAAAP
jgi:hypothetical protein